MLTITTTGAMSRAIKFVKNCIRLRSISCALWVADYEKHETKKP